ncbi:hypothetical protein BX589_1397 [Paraburkholderia fungorum]|nr:hypothetical protein BX589_1397 [Paraburkholderia fungorum]
MPCLTDFYPLSILKPHLTHGAFYCPGELTLSE